MNALIVYCHPHEASLTAAIRDRVILGLTAGGHEIRVLDLYGMGFDPVLTAKERSEYHTPELNEVGVAEHIEALRWCETLIFVYPTWWYGQPAMLKGWLDRVWVPHATFEMPQPMKPVGRILTNIKRIAAVTTLGAPYWWWTFFMKEPGRKILLKGMAAIVNKRCKTTWLALHGIDNTTPLARSQFLDKVEAKFRDMR